MTIGRIPSVEGGIQPTIVDAKGDLIAATAADTVNRLAVGSNDQVLVADSSTSTGLAWKSVATPFAAGKNKIINGDFGIWQRGTSFATGNGAYVYTADRWRTYFYGSNTSNVTQQTFTPGTAPIAGYEGQYFARVSSSATQIVFEQLIEDVRTFAGQTVTFSFWAKQNTAAAGALSVNLYQNFGSGGSAQVTITGLSATSTTTSWTRYTGTVSIPSISGKTIGTSSHLLLGIYNSSLNNALDIWGVQLEAGNVATPFTTATGTLQGELAACQRYYYKYENTGSNTVYGPAGWAVSTTRSFIGFSLPVSMRTTPSATESGLNVYDTANRDVTAITVYSSMTNNAFIQFDLTNAAGSAADTLRNLSFPTNARIELSAEL